MADPAGARLRAVRGGAGIPEQGHQWRDTDRLHGCSGKGSVRGSHSRVLIS